MDPQDDPRWRKNREFEAEYSRRTKEDEVLPPSTLATIPSSMATPSIIEVTVSAENSYKYKPPFTAPPPFVKPSEGPYWYSFPTTTTTTWTTKTKAAAYSESQMPFIYSSSPSSSVTDQPSSASATADDAGWGQPDWNRHREHQNDGGLYAAAVVTPIVVLAIIGLVVFLCMRKRKRQQIELVAAGSKAREMKMPWKPRPLSTAQPYIAPPPAVSPQYTARSHTNLAPPTSVQIQPIILGPIPSGVNGAYLTGIDTSDVVSVTSANNLRPGPPDPFADNSSLNEPPPPYRPRSAAPPSFVTNSRQSSFRATAPPATSQTHLIERSPFDDPVDDDVVSELSGPAAGQSDETMSAVSDLSYQHEPVVNRSSL